MFSQFNRFARKFIYAFMLAALVLTSLGWSGLPVRAQEGQAGTDTQPGRSPIRTHPGQESGPTGAVQDEKGLWYMPEGARPGPSRPAGDLSAQSTGGPDDFGYTWDDGVSESWVSAAAGLDTGFDSDTDQAGPFNLGFTFKYYENSYTQVRISRHGFLSFNAISNNRSQSDIPVPAEPNNVIAPFWMPATGINGYVKYLAGGSGSSHWFAVEWNRLESIGNEYTFEAILYENGDIVFQYGDIVINGGWYCGASGIEDSLGIDGLVVLPLCFNNNPTGDVRFTRPAPSARVNFPAKIQGTLASPGGTTEYEILIRNTGDTGSDVFDLTTSSAWTTPLWDEDGITPLADTDSDGVPDTGSLAVGATATVIARVDVPTGAIVGNSNTAVVTAHSSLDSGVSRTTQLQAVIPSPFAMAYQYSTDDALYLYMAQPGAQAKLKAPLFANWGGDPTIAETSTGMIYLWDHGRCVTNDCSQYIQEIFYGLLDHYGQVIRSETLLADLSGAASPAAQDSTPVVAVAPNGNIAIAWIRKLSDYPSFNDNVWFAVLSPSGSLVQAPTNLTNNTLWEGAGGYSPIFAYPSISATTDNRFMIAWTRYMPEIGGEVDDIYYTVRSDTGSQVVPAARLSQDTPGNAGNSQPVLAGLGSGRAFISWLHWSDQYSYEMKYAVIRSNGTLAKAETPLSKDDSITDWQNWDAVQLTNGRILAVWEGWGCYTDEWKSRLVYVLLDGSYNRIGDPACLGKAPGAVAGEHLASLVASSNGKGVITWSDNLNLYSYYALINGTGAILTPPTAFMSTLLEDSELWLNGYGFGSTSFSVNVTGVDLHVESDVTISAASSPVTVPIRYSNRGYSTGGPITLTATLNNGLTYNDLTDVSSPVVSGNTVTWTLPGLDFLKSSGIDLIVDVPASPPGTHFPIQLAISFPGTDSNPADDQFETSLVNPYQTSLPLVYKNYRPGVTQLRWFVGLGASGGDYQVEIEQQVVEDFNASHSNIELILEAVPAEDARAALRKAIETGNPPDIVGPLGWISSEEFHGDWLDLAPYIQSTNFDTSIFTPALMDMYETPDEGTVALPLAIYPSALYYNPDLFAAAGLNPPPAHYGDLYELPNHQQVAWSWYNLGQVAKLLTLDSHGNNATQAGFDKNNIVQYGFSFGWENHPNYWGSYWQAGSIVQGEAGNYTAVIPDAWKTAWQWVYDGMWGSQPFIPSSPAAGSPEFNDGNVFASGKVAMLENPSWYLCCLGDLTSGGGEFQFGTMPSYFGEVGGRIDADTFRITKTSAHPAEAFTALSYLVTTGAQKLVVGTPQNPPAFEALSAIPSLNGPWLAKMKERFPSVTDASWDVLLEGLNYPDIPSAEGFMPNIIPAWSRIQSFGDILTNNAGVGVPGEINYLEYDLTQIFNQASLSKFGPPDGATDQASELTLSWYSNDVVTNYYYCIDTIDNDSCDTAWAVIGTTPAALVHGLTSLTTYYWQVKSDTPQGPKSADNGNWWHFTVWDTSTKPTEIRWFIGTGTGTDPAQVAIEQQVADDFNATHSDIQLFLDVVTNSAAGEALTMEFNSGHGPDIVGPAGQIGMNSFHGKWLDLASRITSSGFDTSIFNPALLDMYITPDEGTVSLPFVAYPSALYYNPALFTAAGLNPPPAHYGDQYQMPGGAWVDWDWDALTQVARLLTIDSTGKNATEAGFDATKAVQYGFSFGWEGHPNYWATFQSKGGQILVPGGSPGSYAAQLPDNWKATWAWVYDGIWGSQPFIPNGAVAGSADFDSGNVFASGKVAMLDNPSWYLCCINDLIIAGGEFQLGAMPIGLDGTVAGRVDADSFRIWKDTPHPDEAFTVLAYLVTDGVDELVVGTDEQPPAYGGLPAITAKQSRWFDVQAINFPFISADSWDILLAGLNYPDVPSAEAFMPDINQSWSRLQTFADLLTNTQGVDLAVEEADLVNDLNVIFNP